MSQERSVLSELACGQSIAKIILVQDRRNFLDLTTSIVMETDEVPLPLVSKGEKGFYYESLVKITDCINRGPEDYSVIFEAVVNGTVGTYEVSRDGTLKPLS